MKNKRVFLVLLLSLTVLLTGCSLFGGKKGTLNVTVKIDDGTPIASLELVLKDSKKDLQKVKTNAEGFAAFEQKAGDYKVEGTLKTDSGKEFTISESVRIEGEKTSSKDIKVANVGIIEVNVKDKHENDLGEAKVVLKDDQGKELATKVTDSAGVASLVVESGLEYFVNAIFKEDTLAEDISVTATAALIKKVVKLDSVYARTNIALNKEYKSDRKESESYPDTGGQLTDGIYAAVYDFSDKDWVGFNWSGAKPSFATIVVDLVDLYDIDSVAINTLNAGSGIAFPNILHVAVSSDGSNWTFVGSKDSTEELPTELKTVFVHELSIDKEARYVAVQLEFSSGWMFTDEIEILGDALSKKGAPEGVDLEAIDLKAISFE